MKKVSCIICGYNEGPRIGKVLDAILDHPVIDDIIVVDDCSSDNTINEALKFKGIKILKHKMNFGKAYSMLDGCNNVKNDIVLFLDADLNGLTYDNITQLVTPVLDGKVDMTMAICKYNFFLDALSKLFNNEFLNGERAIKKEIAKKILKNVHGYCAEILINQYFLDNNLKFFVVKWLNVKPTLKLEKVNVRKSISSQINGFKQIVSVLSLNKIIKQMLVMGKLAAKYEKELNENL